MAVDPEHRVGLSGWFLQLCDHKYVLMYLRAEKVNELCFCLKLTLFSLQTKEIRNRIARWCEVFQTSLMTSSGASAQHIAGPWGRSITIHKNLIGWWHTSVKLLSNGRRQLQWKASNTSSAGPAGPWSCDALFSSAQPYKKMFSFWNCIVT